MKNGIIILLSILLFAGCKKEEPAPVQPSATLEAFGKSRAFSGVSATADSKSLDAEITLEFADGYEVYFKVPYNRTGVVTHTILQLEPFNPDMDDTDEYLVITRYEDINGRGWVISGSYHMLFHIVSQPGRTEEITGTFENITVTKP